MRPTRPWVVSISSVFVLFLSSHLEAQCVQKHNFNGSGDQIKLVAGTNVTSTLINDAVRMWSSCESYGIGMPTFSTTTSSTGATIVIHYVGGDSPNSACGKITSADANGQRVVTIYDAATKDGVYGDCPAAFWTLAHELGHAYGLKDVALSCSQYVMSGDRNADVNPAECSAVDTIWTTKLEAKLNGGSGGGDPKYDCCTPIVVTLGANGFHFTSLSDGVTFDIDGDGLAERTSWTESRSAQGFLALDRDGDGFITRGSELFGDSTAQPLSTQPNGFAALWVYDQEEFGGNEDGLITPADEIFGALRLWFDGNHDGVSQAGELRTLLESGIMGLDLDTVLSNRRDRHGNLLRWTAPVLFSVGWRPAATDVVLVVEQGPTEVRRHRVGP